MRLSTKSRYAVMAVADLFYFGKGIPVSLSEIAQRQGLPLAYLEQLFARLRRAGLVKSTRGALGGYSLTRPADQIKVMEIMSALEEPLKATRCEKDSAIGCQDLGKRCLTHDLWDELGAVVHLFLSRVTIADVCAKRVLGMGRFGLLMDSKEVSLKTSDYAIQSQGKL